MSVKQGVVATISFAQLVQAPNDRLIVPAIAKAIYFGRPDSFNCLFDFLRRYRLPAEKALVKVCFAVIHQA